MKTTLETDKDAADIPAGAKEVPVTCNLERRRFDCPNGSTFVLLHDETESGWNEYAALIVARSRAETKVKVKVKTL